jgi:phage shock protein A
MYTEYYLKQIIEQGEKMSQQLTDLQTAIAALQTEDTTLVAAVAAAVTALQTLETQLAAAIAASSDTGALEGIATTVNGITANLTTAVASLAAAEPVAPAVVAPVAASATS